MAMQNTILEEKMIHAKKLYLEDALTAKKVCSIVNITEKTMSSWVHKYGWKKARKNKLDSLLFCINKPKGYPVDYEFEKYLQKENPSFLNLLFLEINKFLKS